MKIQFSAMVISSKAKVSLDNFIFFFLVYLM